MNVALFKVIHDTMLNNDEAVQQLPYDDAVRYMARQLTQAVDYHFFDGQANAEMVSAAIDKVRERIEAARIRQRAALAAEAAKKAEEPDEPDEDKDDEDEDEEDEDDLPEEVMSLSETEEEKASGPGTQFAATPETVWASGAEAIAKLLQEDA